MLHDWSGIRVHSHSDDEDDSGARRLLVENTRLTGSLQRLGPAMTAMAHDLARIRRENARLKRENQRLRMVHESSGDTPAAPSVTATAQSSVKSRGPVGAPNRASTSSRSVPWAASTRSKSSP
jgi:hypothetical protein